MKITSKERNERDDFIIRRRKAGAKLREIVAELKDKFPNHAISLGAAHQIVKRSGGAAVRPHRVKAARDRELFELKQGGATAAELSLKFKISDKQVYRIYAEQLDSRLWEGWRAGASVSELSIDFKIPPLQVEEILARLARLQSTRANYQRNKRLVALRSRMTYKELGKEFGISASRAQQIVEAWPVKVAREPRQTSHGAACPVCQERRAPAGRKFCSRRCFAEDCRRRRVKVTDKDVKTALIRSGGNISNAARLLDVAPSTVWVRLKAMRRAA